MHTPSAHPMSSPFLLRAAGKLQLVDRRPNEAGSMMCNSGGMGNYAMVDIEIAREWQS